MKQTVALIVLDGWGLGGADATNPVHAANPLLFARLAATYPVTSLQASGISVGLPWGEVGNSEVGHLTLGAGRVLYQYFPRISMAIQDRSFFSNPVLKDAFAHARQHNGRIHFAGLLTKGSTHAALDHLLALIAMASEEKITPVLHLFADGIDSPPKSLPDLIAKVPRELIGTLSGRFYAMDRNEHWQNTERVYTLMTTDGPVADLDATIKEYFAKNPSEEFIPPFRVAPHAAIAPGDALLFFNFREDSIRQLAGSFFEKEFDAFPRTPIENVFMASMTRYDIRFDAPAAFPPDVIEMPLGRAISEAKKNQLRIAETYKYAHVTYFFNALVEAPFPNEYRVLIPSLNTPHPDQHPELMAPAITDRLIESLRTQAFDFILANYSNADTIGHTGNFDAGVATVGVLDRELTRLVDAAEQSGAVLIITADHGNIEQMVDPRTGMPETLHNPNPVPLYLVGPQFKGRRFPNQDALREETLGLLSDVAPTVLAIMNMPKPPSMTGENLLRDLLY